VLSHHRSRIYRCDLRVAFLRLPRLVVDEARADYNVKRDEICDMHLVKCASLKREHSPLKTKRRASKLTLSEKNRTNPKKKRLNEERLIFVDSSVL